MEIIPYVLIVIVGLVSGILSGISGGGGSMLMIPLYVFLGLPAQNALATMKFTSLGVIVGTLTAFRKTGHIRQDIFKVMAPIAVIIGIVVPLVFVSIASDAFQVILGVIMLLLLPVLFLKKMKISKPKKKHKVLGYSLFTGILFIQGVFGSGSGSLALFVLQGLFGLTKVQAMATRRAVVAVMGPIVLVALLMSGFVSLAYGFVGLVAMLLGTYIGTKITPKRGDRFVTVAMAGAIAVASILMIVGV